MYTTIKDGWLEILIRELKNTSHVRIISPFINEVMVNHLLNNKKSTTKVTLVTRFDLNDFLSGASSLKALRTLVLDGVEIKGIRGLHSKVYLFDNRTAILTSANFTSGGFFNNHEFGIITHDPKSIKESLSYFESLISMDQDLLTIEKIDNWAQQIDKFKIHNEIPNLIDYGKHSLKNHSPFRKYFIKFFGGQGDRVNGDFTVRDMIKGSHCHNVLTFSGKKGRPRKYSDNDIVYLARILNGKDYAIFGCAVAFQHIDSRDIASEQDKKALEKFNEYGVYIRIKEPVFIDGCMQDCPTMSKLINQLGPECFYNTQNNFKSKDHGNIDPWRSLMQQADVRLSLQGAEWLDIHLNKVLNEKGAIPTTFIDSLYKHTIAL